MNRAAGYALFAVSLSLGVMLGLEGHIERGEAPVGQYASYLEASNALQQALAKTPVLRAQLRRAQALHDALLAGSRHASRGLADVQAELRRLDAEAGLTALSGPGVIIEINYDPALPVIHGLRYVDEATQLQMVVNYLLASGASGIAIDGQRLVTTSAIRSVSGLEQLPGPFAGIVQVNDVPISAPYTIAVVGDSTAISNMLEVEALPEQFRLLDQSFRLLARPGSHGVRLPAYSGQLPGQYATEGGE